MGHAYAPRRRPRSNSRSPPSGRLISPLAAPPVFSSLFILFKPSASHARVLSRLPRTVFLIFVFQADDRYNYNGYNKYTFERPIQEAVEIFPMPTCATFTMPLCTTPLAIVHEPADSASANTVSSVISTLLAQNTQILPSEVVYYNTTTELNEAMLAAPLSILAALHFPNDFNLDTKAEVTVQYNQTAYCLFGSKSCTVPLLDVQLPVQTAIEKAILTEATGGQGSFGDLKTSYARFPQPLAPSSRRRDLGEGLAPRFILTASIVSFVIQLNQLVQEKELKLKVRGSRQQQQQQHSRIAA